MHVGGYALGGGQGTIYKGRLYTEVIHNVAWRGLYTRGVLSTVYRNRSDFYLIPSVCREAKLFKKFH